MGYSEHIHRLRKKGYDWLPDIEVNFQDFVNKVSEFDVFGRDIPIHFGGLPRDPYMFARNLSALERGLKRILVIRSKFHELQDKAVHQALEYELFEENTAIQEKLDLAPWADTTIASNVTNIQDAIRGYRAGDHQLSDGKIAELDGQLAIKEATLGANEQRRKLISKKWANVRSHQSALQSRHIEDGHSLNYQQRANKLLNLAREEIVDLKYYQAAVQVYIFAVYVDPDRSPQKSINFHSFDIDALAVWLVQVKRLASQYTDKRCTFEHTVSLNSQYSQGKTLVPDDIFDQAMDTGELKVDLEEYFNKIGSISDLRVKGVTASINHEWSTFSQTAAQRYMFTRMEIVPPKQDPLYANYDAYSSRKPFMIDNVATTNPNIPQKYYKGANIENIKPHGTWTLRLSDILSNVDKGPYKLNKNTLKDVKLHFLLSG